MGMFDTIQIPLEKLPITKAERKKLLNANFQTKSLDCELREYIIDIDGQLHASVGIEYIVPKKDRPYPKGKGLLGAIGMIGTKGVHYEKENYTGEIEFYDLIGKEWFEFRATFEGGKMTNIKKIETA